MLSVIIPSRNEQYLPNTVEDILNKAEGDIEVIVILDGYWPTQPLKDDNRIKVIHRGEPKGMRNAINLGVAISSGKYIMKCDAHCCFDSGFDLKLINDCKKDWTLVPRRYAIDKKKWDRNENVYYDFQYISHPKDSKYPFKGVDWPEYGARVNGKSLVGLMTSQGSCWFMQKSFFEKIGGLDEENYGTMGAEAQEVCLKTWLSGGKYVLTRNTWYAHAKKRESTYGYKKPMDEWAKSRKYAIECWTNNKWDGQTRKLEWLIKKFKPVPGWHTSVENIKNNRHIMYKYKLNQGVEEYPVVLKGLNREGLVELWKELGYRKGCEVGVRTGGFSKMMFDGIPKLEMYLVDPFCNYKGYKERTDKHADNERIARKSLDGCNITWINELSEIAFNEIQDNSLDFVYIDGNHKYDYVLLDMLLWSRKVRSGGMISGHDYLTDKRPYTRDVKKAVDDYTKRHNIAPWYLTDIGNQRTKSDRHASWLWIKG